MVLYIFASSSNWLTFPPNTRCSNIFHRNSERSEALMAFRLAQTSLRMNSRSRSLTAKPSTSGWSGSLTGLHPESWNTLTGQLCTNLSNTSSRVSVQRILCPMTSVPGETCFRFPLESRTYSHHTNIWMQLPAGVSDMHSVHRSIQEWCIVISTPVFQGIRRWFP